MVNGLSRFREAFAAHQEQFTLIGGAAASLWFDRAGLPFRSTKDLDVVLLVESLGDDFLRTFWAFVRDGDYLTWQRSDGGRGYYRFMKPGRSDFPWMLELFTRRSDGTEVWASQEIVPIPAEEDALSLSAILMDPAYYRVVSDYREIVDGLPLLSPPGLIALKARAWLDLTDRRLRGEAVKMDDIRKHRNDIFRLSFLLAADQRFGLPDRVHDDLLQFLESHPPSSPARPEVASAVKRTARLGSPEEILILLRSAFRRM